MRIPDPMLARSAPLPVGGGWRYEVKWDGFRALLARDQQGFRVRSRRGWNMTALLPELAGFPVEGIFDGEIVALQDGKPMFPLVGQRLLHGQTGIALTFVVFDVLFFEGKETMSWPLHERRQLLDQLDLADPRWSASPLFEDGEALFASVCERSMEGIVAKRLKETYRPDARRWVKVKNRDYWRYPAELAAARSKGRRRAFA